VNTNHDGLHQQLTQSLAHPALGVLLWCGVQARPPTCGGPRTVSHPDWEAGYGTHLPGDPHSWC